MTIGSSPGALRGGMATAMNATMMSASKNVNAPVGLVEERYELGELIGEGATGQVFSAHDRELGIEVAVKVMRPALARSPRQVAQFTAEAKIAARMLSPHVVKVFGVAVTRGGAPCIVYERLEGETLSERIAREGRLSLAETVDIVKQTARALARAHMVGVLHRDVKPDNIFLVSDGRGGTLVKLLDFGIAIEADATGAYANGELAGTPEYMAPEVFFGTQAPDQRADVYGLGVVAYECLTGKCPFPGTVVEVLQLLHGGARPELLQHRPDLHRAVDAWMDRVLQPDPYWRFGSVREMYEALESAATLPAVTRTIRPARVTLREAA